MNGLAAAQRAYDRRLPDFYDQLDEPRQPAPVTAQNLIDGFNALGDEDFALLADLLDRDKFERFGQRLKALIEEQF